MNTAEHISDLQAFSSALQGFVMGVVLMYFGLINITIFGHVYQLTFLPVLAVVLWPRQASYSWSLGFVFLLGLLMDMSSGGVLGVWAFTLLVLFLILGGGLKHVYGFVHVISVYILSLVIVMISLLLLGRLAIGQWVSVFSMIGDSVFCILVFPVAYWFYKLVDGFSGVSKVGGK